MKGSRLRFVKNTNRIAKRAPSRRIEGGDDRISTVSFRKNRFCALLKCVSFIFILNIYVSDSIFSVDFTRAVSFCKQVVSSSFYPSWLQYRRKHKYHGWNCLAKQKEKEQSHKKKMHQCNILS